MFEATTSTLLEASAATASTLANGQSFWSTLLQNENAAMILSLIYATWVLVWKGLALWRAAQKKQKIWFVVLLVLNTLGLLEIAYLFVFSKQNWSKIGETLGIEVKPKIAEKIKTKKK